jgi:hypothetical protein
MVFPKHLFSLWGPRFSLDFPVNDCQRTTPPVQQPIDSLLLHVALLRPPAPSFALFASFRPLNAPPANHGPSIPRRGPPRLRFQRQPSLWQLGIGGTGSRVSKKKANAKNRAQFASQTWSVTQNLNPVFLTFAGLEDQVDFPVPNGENDQPFEQNSGSYLGDYFPLEYDPTLGWAGQPLEDEARHMENPNRDLVHFQGDGEEPKGNIWTPKRCAWLGCRSATIFKREYEYDRHMKKHTGVSLPCPVQYCPRQGSRAFYRSDKLREHVKNGHTENENCRCLVEGCTTAAMPLDILRIHFRGHPFDLYYRALVISEYNLRRKCELKKCKKWFQEADQLQEHLLTHCLADRLSQGDVIKQMSFDPNTARIICPVCHQDFANSSEFVPHLGVEHLVTDGDHWLSFIKQASKHLRWFASENLWQKRSKWQFLNLVIPQEMNFCNYCGESTLSGSDPEYIDHHMTLLKKTSDLDKVIAARAAILRLLPDFADHPIFEMDKPSVHRD